MGLITNTFLTSNISIAKEPYKIRNTFIYTILFDLSESIKITRFEDLIGPIIKVKVTEKSKKKVFFHDRIDL